MAVPLFPAWSLFPLPVLVLATALLPTVAVRAWQRRAFQAFVVGVCALPVIGLLVTAARLDGMAEARPYVSFMPMLVALHVVFGGVHVSGDIEAKPSTNVALVIVGSVLAGLVGTAEVQSLTGNPRRAVSSPSRTDAPSAAR